jgi:hypothetical protein
MRIDFIDIHRSYVMFSILSYLDDMACVFSVVKPALHIATSLRPVDDDRKRINASSHVPSEDVRQLILHVASSFPRGVQFIDTGR